MNDSDCVKIKDTRHYGPVAQHNTGLNSIKNTY